MAVSRQQRTTFCDTVHGQMTFNPLLKAIIDTPEFQRLRRISQLGFAQYVYPCSTINRFQHSLGVAHLAGVFAKKLRDNQPDEGISDQDILCCQIGGLLHDIGHGPFSHSFEVFVNQQNPDAKFKHENLSVKIFDHLVKENKLEESFRQCFGDNYRAWLDCIKEQIAGTALSRLENPWPSGKDFLYDLISNKETGADVDKWDYLLRDSQFTGVKIGFDHLRLMESYEIIDGGADSGGSMKRVLAMADKYALNLQEMFHARNQLYRQVYKHKTNVIIEVMHMDAFALADEHLQFVGSDGRAYTLSTAHLDVEAYLQLDDSIVQRITQSPNPALAPAKELLESVEKRLLYKLVDQTNGITDDKFASLTTSKVENEVYKELDNLGISNLSGKIVVQKVTFDYGMQKSNPVEKQLFFDKENIPASTRKRKAAEMSTMLPATYQESHFRCISRSRDPTDVESIRKAFINVWNAKDIATKSLKPVKTKRVLDVNSNDLGKRHAKCARQILSEHGE